MSDLHDLNASWQEKGHPYAVPEPDHVGEVIEGQSRFHHWFCPSCGQQGTKSMKLLGAMNEALGHKKECPEVSLEMDP